MANLTGRSTLRAFVAMLTEKAALHGDRLAARFTNKYVTAPPPWPRVTHEHWSARRKEAQRVAAKWSTAPAKSTKQWMSVSGVEDKAVLLWHIPDGKFRIAPLDVEDLRRQMIGLPSPSKYPFQVMSSAMLLYRLCCLFVGQLDPTAGVPTDTDRGVWGIELTHKHTQQQVHLGDKKGGAYLCPDLFDLKEADLDQLAFQADLLELANMLFAADFPHPYGGIAGGMV